MEELMARTSVEAATARHEVSLTDRDLFNYPFLYLTGKYEFDPFTQEEIEILRRFLSYGGFMLIDDALGQQGYGFDKAVRREMQRVFPGNEFKRLPAGHAALSSYYLLRRIGGVRIVSPALEGITLGNSTPVIYCQNGLGGAWERDQVGKWTNACTPGGEPQRRDAFHLGHQSDSLRHDRELQRRSDPCAVHPQAADPVNHERSLSHRLLAGLAGRARRRRRRGAAGATIFRPEEAAARRAERLSHRAARLGLRRVDFFSPRPGVDRQARDQTAPAADGADRQLPEHGLSGQLEERAGRQERQKPPRSGARETRPPAPGAADLQKLNRDYDLQADSPRHQPRTDLDRAASPV